jgi:hypothetical protein
VNAPGASDRRRWPWQGVSSPCHSLAPVGLARGVGARPHRRRDAIALPRGREAQEGHPPRCPGRPRTGPDGPRVPLEPEATPAAAAGQGNVPPQPGARACNRGQSSRPASGAPPAPGQGAAAAPQPAGWQGVRLAGREGGSLHSIVAHSPDRGGAGGEPPTRGLSAWLSPLSPRGCGAPSARPHQGCWSSTAQGEGKRGRSRCGVVCEGRWSRRRPAAAMARWPGSGQRRATHTTKTEDRGRRAPSGQAQAWRAAAGWRSARTQGGAPAQPVRGASPHRWRQTLGTLLSHWCNGHYGELWTRATSVRAVKGCPVQSHATTAHPDTEGCSCAVALLLRQAVHPCWAWGNAATQQTRTRQPRPSLWKYWRRCAPQRSNLSSSLRGASDGQPWCGRVCASCPGRCRCALAHDGRHLVWPAQLLGSLPGEQPTLPAPPRRTLRMPAPPWALALASDLRSRRAGHVLDPG